MRCFWRLFHEWTQWEGRAFGVTLHRQRRRCKRCGLVQEKITGG